jgi:GDP-4-dehydro-6-deoxy-D-mannose reductase
LPADVSTNTPPTGPVLVTGAAGFVGSYLVELLLEDGAEVVGWRRPGTTALTRATVRWQDIELLDAPAVAAALADLKPAAIFHLAGSAHVADSWQHTRETFKGNVLATHHLLQALHRGGQAPRVLVSGSATVYGPSADRLTEDSALAPASPYATSKLAQEMVAAQAWREQGIPVLLARSFNHVGPRQTPAYVAPSIARQIAAIERGELPPVLKMGNLDPERDVMDVRDTVRAYRSMMAMAEPGVPYNVCGGRAIRIGDLVDLFRARAQVPIAIELDPARMRPSDVPRLWGSYDRLSHATGWAPSIPLEQTVDDLLAWWRTQG